MDQLGQVDISNYNNLVLYDGVCAFCNDSIDFILRYEASTDLIFTPLQSEVGKSILLKYGFPEGYLESILFLQNGKLLANSNAGLAIVGFLKKPLSWLTLLKVLPEFLRDGVYRFIARNRYKWFGKFDSCRVPSSELKRRFIL
ncbi:thiol-disulfide oxidoreductase DCC family protein [Reichenbachiella versicolor]|uniref:thiol-disulfide oxidoreductase DCC family protein n=1 Tax=Reichenbachiella versicolor TaxID=1821036 RepID=UPI000D6E89BD|nr:DCC1-like thiol-disulfide oxidoreductase family protein [Reichenbachiella versicolor]